jgi:hypothetical protein
LDKVGEGSGEREGKFENVSVPPQPTPKDKFASKPNQPREKSSEEASEKPSEKPSESLVKSLIPSLSPDQSVSIVSFVEKMVTRESFAIRERERQEWLRSGLTRTSTTLLMVCLSLVCHYLRERTLCVRFRHGEMRNPVAAVVVWRGRSDRPG